MDHRSEKWTHTGAILCGGSSSRMGAPKHGLKLPDGRTMIQTIFDTVGEVCSRIVILGPKDILPELTHVYDLREDQGPLAGIEALLASDLDEQYLVVPCDVPLITAEVLRKLTIESDALATAFRIEGSDSPESLPLRISAIAQIEASRHLDAGNRSLHRLLSEVSTQTVLLSPPQSNALRNINTPEAYSCLTDSE